MFLWYFVLEKLLPFGQVPILEIDGVVMAQTFAITRFLANEFGKLELIIYCMRRLSHLRRSTISRAVERQNGLQGNMIIPGL